VWLHNGLDIAHLWDFTWSTPCGVKFNTPPEHKDDYIPPSKRKPAEEPAPSYRNTTSNAGAREASADHIPAGEEGRDQDQSEEKVPDAEITSKEKNSLTKTTYKEEITICHSKEKTEEAQVCVQVPQCQLGQSHSKAPQERLPLIFYQAEEEREEEAAGFHFWTAQVSTRRGSPPTLKKSQSSGKKSQKHLKQKTSKVGSVTLHLEKVPCWFSVQVPGLWKASGCDQSKPFRRKAPIRMEVSAKPREEK
jgi:hypothetical protein